MSPEELSPNTNEDFLPTDQIGYNHLELIENDFGMEIYRTPIEGLFVWKRKAYGDERGMFTETYSIDKSEIIKKITGIDMRVAQLNASYSETKVARGLHSEPENKQIHTTSGEVLGFWADIRLESKTYGKVFVYAITPFSDTIIVTNGIANGFFNMGDTPTIYNYIVTLQYRELPSGSGEALSMLDPIVSVQLQKQLKPYGLTWPPEDIIISDRDKEGLTFTEAAINYSKITGEMNPGGLEG